MDTTNKVLPTLLTWTLSLINADRYTSENVSYGVKDTRGRDVGGFAVIEKALFACGVAEVFTVRIFSTRDGERFGAYPAATRPPVDTLEAAQAHAAIKLDAARKRALRVHAPPRRYSVGEILTDKEATAALGKSPEGKTLMGVWFEDARGELIYICDGVHKDGTRGFKVLQIGGLK